MKRSTIVFILCAVSSMIIAEKITNDLIQVPALILFVLFLILSVSDGGSYLNRIKGVLPVVYGLLAMTAIGIGLVVIFTIFASIIPGKKGNVDVQESPCTDYNPYYGGSC